MCRSHRSVTLGYWGLLASYAGLIFWFSSLSSTEIPGFFEPVWDKLLHVASFGVLALLFLAAAIGGFLRPLSPMLAAAALLFAPAYHAIVSCSWPARRKKS